MIRRYFCVTFLSWAKNIYGNYIIWSHHLIFAYCLFCVCFQEKDYVGFATLPNQVHRKSVKKGFDFTLMVAGTTLSIFQTGEKDLPVCGVGLVLDSSKRRCSSSLRSPAAAGMFSVAKAAAPPHLRTGSLFTSFPGPVKNVLARLESERQSGG